MDLAAQKETAEPRGRELLSGSYAAVRQATEALTAALTPEDQMVQSMPEASPAKWHLAHTTWFFETFILARYAARYRPFDEEFCWLFNSYYKQLGTHPHRGQRGGFSRPGLERVMAYRGYVDENMQALRENSPPAEVAELVTLGLNHEQQHQELIVSDIKHAFWSQPLRPAYGGSRAENEDSKIPPELSWQGFEGGIYDTGHSGEGFAFDNERPRHQTLLRPFRLASRLVTNGEYLEFMGEGGYRRPELWLSDGWDTVCQQRWESPLYWEQNSSGWRVFTCGGTREVNGAEPVCHVSFYEADAFARWAGARLPSEAEWEVAANLCAIEGNFAEAGRFQPAPARDGGLCQMFGDLWEWTSSPYIAYPGFKPAAGVVGEYNGKFMVNQMVLRGGSCATPQSHIRASYRNFFPAHARWQFMGIRLANDER